MTVKLQFEKISPQSTDFNGVPTFFEWTTDYELTTSSALMPENFLQEIIQSFGVVSSDVYTVPQEEGGFVAFSKTYEGAVGQGETIEEAINDLREAIDLLKEVLEEDKHNE